MQISVKRDSPWREEVIRNMRLAASDLHPVIARFLHSEKRSRGVNPLEGLAHWELEFLSVFFLVDPVRISSERYGLLGRELARELGCQHRGHA